MLQTLPHVFILDDTEVYFSKKNNIPQLKDVLNPFIRQRARDKLEESNTYRPNISELTPDNFGTSFLLDLKHFGSKKVLSAHVMRHLIVLAIKERRDSKVNENGLIVVIHHDVVRLDISVNDFDDLVAVVQSSQDVNQVQTN